MGMVRPAAGAYPGGILGRAERHLYKIVLPFVWRPLVPPDRQFLLSLERVQWPQIHPATGMHARSLDFVRLLMRPAQVLNPIRISKIPQRQLTILPPIGFDQVEEAFTPRLWVIPHI